MQPVIKRLDAADERRTFENGHFELVELAGMTLGRASYEPGWIWSRDVGSHDGLTSCPVEHVGLVVSGRAMVKMDDGAEIEMKPGDVFHVPPGHDSWVVGDEPYVSLHFLGASGYASEGAPTPQADD